jgi:hypothetical protein
MTLRRRTITLLNSILGAADAQLVRKSELTRLQSELTRLQRRDELLKLISRKPEVKELLRNSELLSQPSYHHSPLPTDAGSYLRHDNPRLLELRQRYHALNHPAIVQSVWTNEYIQNEIDLRYFRGDNAYVWQQREMLTELNYLLTAYYVQIIDEWGLLKSLGEDELFGIYTVKLDGGLKLSRDLLDSIVEIYFLERNLKISHRTNLNIIDIGAGYGRLAYRMVKALSEVGLYYCVDPVPESTFISEYYLRFRGVDDKAVVIPLDDFEALLLQNKIDLAINIHSFAESPFVSIKWWIGTLARHKVRYLMIAPNEEGPQGGQEFMSREGDGSSLDFLATILENGYKLIAREPKYLDASVQKYGVRPPIYHHLFELNP